MTFILCIAFAVGLGGCRRGEDVPPPEIAVSNSYLYAIVRDLCGDATEIFCVVPPGMCPGHFDIRPSDVQRLYASRVLLAFDFQESIGGILPENGSGPAFHTITPPPGMCIPASYLDMAQQTAEVLIAEYPDCAAHFRDRLDAIGSRIAALEQECADTIQRLGLIDAPVLTSRHQSAFAEWLGLAVAATFTGRDAETAANINAALRQSDGSGVRWIIANRQEGTQLAEAMANRLGVPVAVFSNFPTVFADALAAPAFDAMVRDNLRQLGEAVQ
jgi:zinc transport system substrate-binding protein